MTEPSAQRKARGLSRPASASGAVRADASGRSSPLSSDFEDLGLDEGRSMSLVSGQSGVLVDASEDLTDSPSSGRVSTSPGDDGSERYASPAAAIGAQAAESPAAAAAPRAQAATPSAGGGKTPDDAVYNTLRELEDAGHKVADFAKAAASDVTKKLFGGGGGGPSRVVGEDFSVGKLAAGVSSWWAALDPTAVLADAPSPAQSAASPSKTEVQAFFGLPPTEELLEKFTCTLMQSYSCVNNHFTGPRQLAYPGKLYITDHNSCFRSDVEETTLMLPHSDVTHAEKLPSSLDGDTGGLKVSFGDENQFVLFRAFKGVSEGVDSALALLEHVTASKA